MDIKVKFFNPLPHNDEFLSPPPREKPFENIVGKEENAGYQYILLFPKCFLHYERQN